MLGVYLVNGDVLTNGQRCESLLFELDESEILQLMTFLSGYMFMRT